MSPISAHRDGVSLSLKVKAHSRRSSVKLEAEWVKVEVQAPAVDGKANAAVIALLAERLKLKPAHIELLRGERDTRKVVLVRGVSVAHIEVLLNGSLGQAG